MRMSRTYPLCSRCIGIKAFGAETWKVLPTRCKNIIYIESTQDVSFTQKNPIARLAFGHKYAMINLPVDRTKWFVQFNAVPCPIRKVSAANPLYSQLL